jgi:hypothetical protein
MRRIKITFRGLACVIALVVSSWVYFDGSGTGNRLSAKFTLGHTDKGAQAWDWRAGFWLPKAVVAWRPTAGGYAYEAAIPWESLGVYEAKPSQRLGIEIGRGVGGNSFLDLSGRDPDSAGNLVPLLLVEQAGQPTPPAASSSVSASSVQSDSVAFNVSVNSLSTFTVTQLVSPDRDYLWLDRMNTEPLKLKAGPNLLRVGYVGRDPNRVALVDAFFLSPAVVSRAFTGPDGKLLRLSYDMRAGTLMWKESIK